MLSPHKTKPITPEIANLLKRKSEHGKLVHQSGKCRIYDLGNGILCKQRPMLPKKYEGATLSYVREHTDIPAPKVEAEHLDSWTGVYFLFMEKIPGRTLSEAWPGMGGLAREAAADTVAEYARQLNKLKSNRLESVAHGPLFDKYLFRNEDQPYGPLKSMQDLYERLASEFRPRLPEDVARVFHSEMPRSDAFSLCHGNLAAPENVIVDDAGTVVGLVDWEDAGFFPSWWEATKLAVNGERNGYEWRAMLKMRLEQHPPAERFMWRVKAFRG